MHAGTQPSEISEEAQPATRHAVDLPGPRPLPFLGNLVRPSQANDQFEAWARQYGPMFKFYLGRQLVVGICDPDITRAVLQDRPDGFTRPMRGNEVMGELGVRGVFAAEGDDWRRQRRLLNPSFHGRHLDSFAEPIRIVTERLRDYWLGTARRADPAGEDVLSDLMRYSVDVTSVVSFGHDLDTVSRGDSALQRRLSRIFDVLQQRINSPVDYWRLPLVGLPTRRVMSWVRRFMHGLLREGRRSLQEHPERREKPHTLLESMLLANEGEDSKHPLTDEEVAANVITLLLAGEDTTANTLAWMLYHLARHPDVLARARAEADEILGDAEVPTLEQARRLQYIDSVAQETLRMTPPTPLMPAQARRAIVVGGVAIPKGTVLMLMTRLIATTPGVYERPQEFDPSRWIGGTPEERRRRKRMMMAFGSGPRVCPGRSLALLECAMVTAMVLRTFDISVADPRAPVGERTSFTVQPTGIRIRFRERSR